MKNKNTLQSITVDSNFNSDEKMILHGLEQIYSLERNFAMNNSTPAPDDFKDLEAEKNKAIANFSRGTVGDKELVIKTHDQIINFSNGEAKNYFIGNPVEYFYKRKREGEIESGVASQNYSGVGGNVINIPTTTALQPKLYEPVNYPNTDYRAYIPVQNGVQPFYLDVKYALLDFMTFDGMYASKAKNAGDQLGNYSQEFEFINTKRTVVRNVIEEDYITNLLGQKGNMITEQTGYNVLQRQVDASNRLLENIKMASLLGGMAPAENPKGLLNTTGNEKESILVDTFDVDISQMKIDDLNTLLLNFVSALYEVEGGMVTYNTLAIPMKLKNALNNVALSQNSNIRFMNVGATYFNYLEQYWKDVTGDDSAKVIATPYLQENTFYINGIKKQGGWSGASTGQDNYILMYRSDPEFLFYDNPMDGWIVSGFGPQVVGTSRKIFSFSIVGEPVIVRPQYMLRLNQDV